MTFGAVLVILLVSITGIVLYSTQPIEYPLLDPVPPSDVPPQNLDSPEVIQIGPLNLSSSANATGFIPHLGPMTFRMVIEMNITNTGSDDITDFRALKASVYSNENLLFYTFDFQSDWNVTITAGDTVTLHYRNRETRIQQPFDPFVIYVRVLVSFADQEAIITTPILFGMFAIE